MDAGSGYRGDLGLARRARARGRVRDRAAARLRGALRGRGSRGVARPGARRHAASRLRGPRLSLAQRRRRRDVDGRIRAHQRRRGRRNLATEHLLPHRRDRMRPRAPTPRPRRSLRLPPARRLPRRRPHRLSRRGDALRPRGGLRRHGLRLFALDDPAPRGVHRDPGRGPAAARAGPGAGGEERLAGADRPDPGRGLSRSRRRPEGAERPHLARRRRRDHRGPVVLGPARLHDDLRHGAARARSCRSSTIMPRRRSPPSRRPAARC